MRKQSKTFKLVLTALFIAIAYVLPFLTVSNPKIGNMFCPMHLPILICGFVCGWQYGLVAGLITPILRSVTMGMPQMFPDAICMAVELATYGAMTGVMFKLLPRKKWCIYPSLIIAMIVGRIVWGIVRFAVVGFDVNEFGLAVFWAKAFTNAIPGIILQIALIPPIIMFINKRKDIL